MTASVSLTSARQLSLLAVVEHPPHSADLRAPVVAYASAQSKAYLYGVKAAGMAAMSSICASGLNARVSAQPAVDISASFVHPVQVQIMTLDMPRAV